MKLGFLENMTESPPLKRVPLMKKEPAWLGFDSLNGRYLFGTDRAPAGGLVEPKQVVSIVASCYQLFKGERLFVKRDCASDFLIREIFVGARNTGKVNQDPIIAEPFAVDFEGLAKIEEALFDGKVLKIVVDKKAVDLLGQPWTLPACAPGWQITFNVENIGEAPLRFLAAFSGHSVS